VTAELNEMVQYPHVPPCFIDVGIVNYDPRLAIWRPLSRAHGMRTLGRMLLRLTHRLAYLSVRVG
jgi:hypothetical protein